MSAASRPSAPPKAVRHGSWLNGDMKAAGEAFMVADAWGHFDGTDYAKELDAAGWQRTFGHIRLVKA